MSMAFCEVKAPAIGGCSDKWPPMRSSGVLFAVILIKLLYKQSYCWWFWNAATIICIIWHHYNAAFHKMYSSRYRQVVFNKQTLWIISRFKIMPSKICAYTHCGDIWILIHALCAANISMWCHTCLICQRWVERYQTLLFYRFACSFVGDN